MFHSSSGGATFYTNTTVSIDCDAEPLRPWRHGYDVMKALREVSKIHCVRKKRLWVFSISLVSVTIYRVAQKRPELCITIMAHILYSEKFLSGDL